MRCGLCKADITATGLGTTDMSVRADAHYDQRFGWICHFCKVGITLDLDAPPPFVATAKKED